MSESVCNEELRIDGRHSGMQQMSQDLARCKHPGTVPGTLLQPHLGILVR